MEQQREHQGSEMAWTASEIRGVRESPTGYLKRPYQGSFFVPKPLILLVFWEGL